MKWIRLSLIFFLMTVCRQVSAETLYSIDAWGNQITTFDAITGVVSSTCASRYLGVGIAVIGNFAYYVCLNDNHVYKIDLTTCTDYGAIFQVPQASSLASIAYDGTYFWLGTMGTNNGYQYTLTGTYVSTITLPLRPVGGDGFNYYGGTLVANRGDYVGPFDLYNMVGNVLKATLINESAANGVACDGTDYFIDHHNGMVNVYDLNGNFVRTFTETGTVATHWEGLSLDYQQVLFTNTPTPTGSLTPTPTPTGSLTATPTPTGSFSATSTSTSTGTLSPTATFTTSPTFTFSPTPTYTLTATYTSTPTYTFTITPTFTNTLPPGTNTFTPLPTNSFTATYSFTFTFSPTPSYTSTPTYTLTPTNSPTITRTPTITWTPTLTFTMTPAVDIFSVDRNLWNPSQDGPVSIHVATSSGGGNYSLRIYNTAGEHIKTLDEVGRISTIDKTYTWDGKNKFGDACASGTYIFYLVEPYSRKVKRILLVR